MAGAITIGAAASDAAARAEPQPRGSVPPICRHAVSIGDWYTAHKCKEAWLAMYERSRRRSGRGRELPRWPDRYDSKHKTERRSPSPRPIVEPAPRPAAPHPPSSAPPSPTRSKSTPPPASTAPVPDRPREQAEDLDSRPASLQPVLLLGLLLPAAAAICYPFRHRIYAAATAGLPAFPAAEIPEMQPATFSYRSTLDPFAIPATGLSGPGAAPTARVLALTALDEHGDDSLVVIPRHDAGALFGLAEDELLDDNTAGLFIPGNLDAALAYLETELAIRENTGVTQARRLLLVADCAKEADRIKAILTRHPGGISAVLMGPWTGDRATIDDNGLVDAPPDLASTLPERLPAMSRTEARDRLLTALARHREPAKPPTRRRSTPRRANHRSP
ncbi:hypothetical protein ACQPZP_18455 [Spirillospora sp. CA-142024]|uniref:hypothetical protein n=1 Tax=Spirillospora sp. CA-142024 TaxID=3240036 RepID=UPI003D8ECAC9